MRVQVGKWKPCARGVVHTERHSVVDGSKPTDRSHGDPLPQEPMRLDLPIVAADQLPPIEMSKRGERT